MTRSTPVVAVGLAGDARLTLGDGLDADFRRQYEIVDSSRLN